MKTLSLTTLYSSIEYDVIEVVVSSNPMMRKRKGPRKRGRIRCVKHLRGNLSSVADKFRLHIALQYPCRGKFYNQIMANGEVYIM